ncbi:hypothetical protein E4U17_006901 [Claviceps sp. LM77 group G4]|nr:hypothetical protein E4U17_006901 [Claviceps sp. LM77 group G4]
MSGADFVPSFELGRRQINFLPVRSAPSAPVELPRRPNTEGQQISEVGEPVRNQTGESQTLEALDTATRSLKLKVRKKQRRTAAGSTCFRIMKQSRKEYVVEEIKKAMRDAKEGEEKNRQMQEKLRQREEVYQNLRRENELLRRQKSHEHVESELTDSGPGRSAPPRNV